jgi:hypothetical protein
VLPWRESTVERTSEEAGWRATWDYQAGRTYGPKAVCDTALALGCPGAFAIVRSEAGRRPPPDRQRLRAAARAELAYPATARFPGEPAVAEPRPGMYHVTLQVDAQNGSGSTVRTAWCVLVERNPDRK